MESCLSCGFSDDDKRFPVERNEEEGSNVVQQQPAAKEGMMVSNNNGGNVERTAWRVHGGRWVSDRFSILYFFAEYPRFNTDTLARIAGDRRVWYESLVEQGGGSYIIDPLFAVSFIPFSFAFAFLFLIPVQLYLYPLYSILLVHGEIREPTPSTSLISRSPRVERPHKRQTDEN